MRFVPELEVPPPELEPEDEPETPEAPEEPEPDPLPSWGPARTGRFFRWF